MNDKANVVVQWFKEHRWYALVGFLLGIPIGSVTIYLIDRVSFWYIFLGALVVGTSFGAVVGYLIRHYARKP